MQCSPTESCIHRHRVRFSHVDKMFCCSKDKKVRVTSFHRFFDMNLTLAVVIHPRPSLDEALRRSCDILLAMGRLSDGSVPKSAGLSWFELQQLPTATPTPSDIHRTCGVCLDALSSSLTLSRSAKDDVRMDDSKDSSPSPSPSQSRIVTLPCLHRFHEACVTPWLSKQNKCPSCRTAVQLPRSRSLSFA